MCVPDTVTRSAEKLNVSFMRCLFREPTTVAIREYEKGGGQQLLSLSK